MSPEVLAAGVKWNWETFPEYMNALERLPKGINYATYIGHSALRTWAMGERAFTAEATPADLAAMKEQLADAMRAGAVDCPPRAATQHETSDDKKVASRLASWDEIQQLVGTLGELGTGVFEIAQEQTARVPDPVLRAEFFARMKDLVVGAVCPPASACWYRRKHATPGRTSWRCWTPWRPKAADDRDRPTRGGVVILLSFLTQLPFDRLPEWKALRDKPVAEQKKRCAIRRCACNWCMPRIMANTAAPSAPKHRNRTSTGCTCSGQAAEEPTRRWRKWRRNAASIRWRP